MLAALLIAQAALIAFAVYAVSLANTKDTPPCKP